MYISIPLFFLQAWTGTLPLHLVLATVVAHTSPLDLLNIKLALSHTALKLNVELQNAILTWLRVLLSGEIGFFEPLRKMISCEANPDGHCSFPRYRTSRTVG